MKYEAALKIDQFLRIARGAAPEVIEAKDIIETRILPSYRWSQAERKQQRRLSSPPRWIGETARRVLPIDVYFRRIAPTIPY